MDLLRVVCLLLLVVLLGCDASCNCVDGVCVMLVFVFVLIRFGVCSLVQVGLFVCIALRVSLLAFCCLCFIGCLMLLGLY